VGTATIISNQQREVGKCQVRARWNISFCEPAHAARENAPAPIGLHLAKTLASDPSLKLLLAKVESRMEISGLKGKEPLRIIFLSGTTCARSEPAFRTEASIVAAIVGRTLEHFSDESFVLRAPNVGVVERKERSEDFSHKRETLLRRSLCKKVVFPGNEKIST
jgi:hypothetical protein